MLSTRDDILAALADGPKRTDELDFDPIMVPVLEVAGLIEVEATGGHQEPLILRLKEQS